MTMAEEIAEAIDNDLHAVGIFIDLSNAFDNIDHYRKNGTLWI